MNKLCLQKIWADTVHDLGAYQFNDGSIYEYSTPGSAQAAADVADFILHGLQFNAFPHRKRGQTGYTKLGAAPGYPLLWSYPPYAPTGTL